MTDQQATQLVELAACPDSHRVTMEEMHNRLEADFQRAVGICERETHGWHVPSEDPEEEYCLVCGADLA
jgi:hypothetical protein